MGIAGDVLASPATLSSSKARAKTYLEPGSAILGGEELVLIVRVFQHRRIRKVNAFAIDSEILVDVVRRARVQLVAGSDLRNGLSGAVDRRRRKVLQELIAPVDRYPTLDWPLVVERHGIGRVGQAGHRELVGEVSRVQLLVAIRQRTIELDTKAGLSKGLLNRRFLPGYGRRRPGLGSRNTELRGQSRCGIEQRRFGIVVNRSGGLIQNDEISDVFVEQTQ